MLRTGTLLERLARARDTGPRSSAGELALLSRSILTNLRRLLNSRPGHAPAQMDYGIPAPSDVAHSGPESIEAMQQLIRRAIETYEPRLSDVSVTYVVNPDDALNLRFMISGQVRGTSESLSFTSMIDQTGQVRLEG